MADKVIVTKSKLTGLGDKIRAKTGSTDKMTIDAMNAALDNVGGGASVEWENAGISPDTSKLLEIYFNTSLSETEVVDIIKNASELTWVDTGMNNIYIANLTTLEYQEDDPYAANIAPDTNYVALKLEAANFYAIMNYTAVTLLTNNNMMLGKFAAVIFVSDPYGQVAPSFGLNFTGWNTEITYPLKAVSSVDFAYNKVKILQNNDLFSTTPYTSGNISLSNTYLGNPIEVKTYGGDIVIDIEDMISKGELPSKIYIKDGLQDRADFSCQSLFNHKSIGTGTFYEFLQEKINAFKNLKARSIEFNEMFYDCQDIVNIPFEIDFINASRATDMFQGCINLTNVTIKNIKIDLQVGSGSDWGHLLTLDSLIGICKECINTGSALTLTVGSANLEKIQNSGKYYKFVDSSVTEVAVGEKGEIEECESTVTGSFSITDYMAMKNWTLA